MSNDKPACPDFQSWNPLFEEHTYCDSIVLEIPSDVMKYLNEDGIVLPREVYDERKRIKIRREEERNRDNDSSDEDDDEPEPASAEYDFDGDIMEAPTFPEFSRQISAAIEALNGKAFIKGNLSAPTDACWITATKSMKCTTLEDVYLLLKASSKLMEDYNSRPESKCRLIFKTWLNIHPSTEFRCFVLDKRLIGITQRDCSDYHRYIPEREVEIMKDIQLFFKRVIKEHYPMDKYSFDVLRLASGRVILIDFGKFKGKGAKGYLFEWDELRRLANKKKKLPEFRYISSNSGVQPKNDFTGFCVPEDLKKSRNNREIIDSIIELLERSVERRED